MASEGYKVFMAKIVASVGDVIKKNKVEDMLQIQSLQMMANGICMCIQEILKNEKSSEFEKALSEEWKSPERLLNFCVEKTKALAIKGANGAAGKIPVMVTSDQMCSWIKEYFALDDKAQVEEEIKKAEEAKKAAEEKAAKKAAADAKKKERQAKDLKKAETLIEKAFTFSYKFTEKDTAFFEKLRKEGLVGFNSENSTWFIKDQNEEPEEIEDEIEPEDEDEEDLDFVDAE